MTYSLLILPRTKRELVALEAGVSEFIKQKIEALAEDPRPPGCKKLAGREGWRIRAGDYRLIYEIDDTARTVLILHVGHRRDIYR